MLIIRKTTLQHNDDCAMLFDMHDEALLNNRMLNCWNSPDVEDNDDFLRKYYCYPIGIDIKFQDMDRPALISINQPYTVSFTVEIKLDFILSVIHNSNNCGLKEFSDYKLYQLLRACSTKSTADHFVENKYVFALNNSLGSYFELGNKAADRTNTDTDPILFHECKFLAKLKVCEINVHSRYCLPWYTSVYETDWVDLPANGWKYESQLTLNTLNPIDMIAVVTFGRENEHNLVIAMHAPFPVIVFDSCGNDNCEREYKENCTSCERDCGKCHFRVVEIVSISMTIIHFIIFFCCFSGKLYTFRSKYVWDDSWLIRTNEVLQVRTKPYRPTEKDVKKFQIDWTEQLTEEAHVSLYELTVKTGNLAKGEIVRCKLAEIRSTIVTVHYVTHPSDFKLDKKLMEDITNITKIHHLNLNTLIGIRNHPTDQDFVILWEYQSLGSLSDLIQRDESTFNWDIKLSFITDVCRGLKELHGLGIIHGRLTPRKCIVTQRFIVKISDYGLDEIKYNTSLEVRLKRIYDPIKIICTAPELFQEPPIRQLSNDIYSFAFIMYVVLMKRPIWTSTKVLPCPGYQPDLPTFQEVVADDEFTSYTSEYIRPDGLYLVNLMSQCWVPNYDDRPNIEYIHDQLFHILPVTSAMENVVTRLGKKCDLLEEEHLLMLQQYLPTTVLVRSLKLNEKVYPVTITNLPIAVFQITGIYNGTESRNSDQIMRRLKLFHLEVLKTVSKYKSVFRFHAEADRVFLCSGIKDIYSDDNITVRSKTTGNTLQNDIESMLLSERSSETKNLTFTFPSDAVSFYSQTLYNVLKEIADLFNKFQVIPLLYSMKHIPHFSYRALLHNGRVISILHDELVPKLIFLGSAVEKLETLIYETEDYTIKITDDAKRYTQLNP
ncbi:hypothetical protein SNEBB_010941 [Seison nebaliae]|nr:hypothetical protein SNEBB_010941 [Seison nebaliae]